MGPLYFVIFISDLPDCVCPGNTIAMYADDCKTFRVIDNSHNQTLFQRDLDNLDGMDFNLKKCKISEDLKEERTFRYKFVHV